MYIKNTNPNTRYLYDEDIMEDEYEQPGIEFYDREEGAFRVARVKQDVGNALVESDEYDTIETATGDERRQAESESDDTDEDEADELDEDPADAQFEDPDESPVFEPAADEGTTVTDAEDDS